MDKVLRLQLRLYPHRESDAKILEIFEGSINPNATLKQLLYELSTNIVTPKVTIHSQSTQPIEEPTESFEAINADDIDLF
mgnify:FL=1